MNHFAILFNSKIVAQYMSLEGLDSYWEDYKKAKDLLDPTDSHTLKAVQFTIIKNRRIGDPVLEAESKVVYNY